MTGLLDARAAAILTPRPPGSLDLTGEVALVTGACGRLGPVWIAALERAGAMVIGTDTEDAKRGDAPFKGVETYCADLRDADAVEALMVSLFSVQPITILVNNAGVDDRPSGLRTRAEQAEAMVRVNLLGTWHMLEACGRRMAAQGKGAIINIASLYGLVAPDLRYYDHRADGFQKHPLYGATKAGIVSLTQYYAAAFGPAGVRVNALAPGGIQVPADVLTGQDRAFSQKYTDRIPLGRFCTPADLEGPLRLFAAQGAGFVTGQCLAIDGGYLAW